VTVKMVVFVLPFCIWFCVQCELSKNTGYYGPYNSYLLRKTDLFFLMSYDILSSGYWHMPGVLALKGLIQTTALGEMRLAMDRNC